MRSSDRRPRPASIAARGCLGFAVAAADLHRPALERLVADQRAGERVLARTFKAGDADDLSRPKLEADVVQLPVGSGANGERRRARRLRGARGIEVSEIAADHRANEPAGRRLRQGSGHHRAPVLEHSDPVGNRLNFDHPVRDVDDRHPLGAELAHEIEQAGRIDPVESRGRLVHDEDSGVDRQRLGDFDNLLVGDRKVRGQRIGRDRRAEPPQEAAGLIVHGPPVEDAETGGFDAEKDVLRHRAMRQQAQLLVDDADACAPGGDRVRKRDLSSIEPDGPAVGPVNAAEDLDQRRFPRAVLAAEGVNLAARAAEADGVERLHAWKRLTDVEHFERERRLLQKHSSRVRRRQSAPYSAAMRSRSACRWRGSRCSLPSFMIIANRSGPTSTD